MLGYVDVNLRVTEFGGFQLARYIADDVIACGQEIWHYRNTFRAQVGAMVNASADIGFCEFQKYRNDHLVGIGVVFFDLCRQIANLPVGDFLAAAVSD